MARDLALHFLALLLYPGGLLTLAVGVICEAGVAVAVTGAGIRGALLGPIARLPGVAARAAAARPGVPLLALLAASQLAAPLNPISPVERSLLVAAIALAAATWLGWAGDWTTPGARVALFVQACWLVSLLAPALVSESLRPQALGAVVVPAELPLKVAAGLLGLVCLPALLRLPPAADSEEPAAVRLFLWLPLCGLFASLFFPPGADDAGGMARFLAVTLAVAAVAIGLARLARRDGTAERLYPRLLVPMALVVLGVAAVTSLLT